MKTLIVDDEPIARRILREELETFPDVEIVGEAENGKQALEQIVAHQPDLVFLDLQMPVMGGFEVVRRLGGGHLPVVVIVTAFDQYSIDAFEAGTIDYLLKPVSQARLQIAVDRAQRLRHKPLEVANEVARIASASLSSGSATARKVVGRKGGDFARNAPEGVAQGSSDRRRSGTERHTTLAYYIGVRFRRLCVSPQRRPGRAAFHRQDGVLRSRGRRSRPGAGLANTPPPSERARISPSKNAPRVNHRAPHHRAVRATVPKSAPRRIS